MKLGYPVTATNQSKKLSFCGLQGSIRHIVHEANVHFADILGTCTLQRQHIAAFALEALKTRQARISNDRHL